ncbi:MAG: hypothetical protein PQ612_09020 [Rickettsiales bacterium]|nr:hypothetical protein [Pseudomonadota bacterium]MDG4544114.1 hypothetical protein [Rickettsiales bacterium]MDG4546295.1 hypothetical protein [Rickettsiales bacterium]MDG4548438.1 hypothetical protein [Rickettsiales bacterium]
MATNKWSDYLDAAYQADMKLAFANDSRSKIYIDSYVRNDVDGIFLNRKSANDNPLGKKRDSVVLLVKDMNFPSSKLNLPDLKGLNDLVNRFQFAVDDASPDSVMGLIFFAARQSGVDIPEEVWEKWEPLITKWEIDGIVENPSKSWVVLASVLAHAQYSKSGKLSSEDMPNAWQMVVGFAIESLKAGYDPSNIPDNITGKWLDKARANFEQELALYERIVHRGQVHQLLLPIEGTNDRRRLVDVLFMKEVELSGAMKVLARTDKINSPLNMGFTVLVLERPSLKKAHPKYWMTISLDTRAGLHLRDLWKELEAIETKAWKDSKLNRPKFIECKSSTKGSRLLGGIPKEEQKFHDQWYIDDYGTIIASPGGCLLDTDKSKHSESDDRLIASQLSRQKIYEALFRIYDPVAEPLVGNNKGKETVRLLDVEEQPIIDTGKLLISAWWPKNDPLPHPRGKTPWFGLSPTVLRGMASRTLKISPDNALINSPELEEIDIVPFNNGLAIITSGGVFLLDSGRNSSMSINRAQDIVKSQACCAKQLDELQIKVADLSASQTNDLNNKCSIKSARLRQSSCTNMQSQIIKIRGTMDSPLETDASDLQGLKATLSKKWNISKRIEELTSEIDWIERTGRTAEELRTFDAGKFAAWIALAFLSADALAARVTNHLQSGVKELEVFWLLFFLTLLLAWFSSFLFRDRALHKCKRNK